MAETALAQGMGVCGGAERYPVQRDLAGRGRPQSGQGLDQLGLAVARNTGNAEELAGTDGMKLFVCGSPNGDHVNLLALLDNLGKGASGAAVQNMNLMLAS